MDCLDLCLRKLGLGSASSLLVPCSSCDGSSELNLSSSDRCLAALVDAVGSSGKEYRQLGIYLGRLFLCFVMDMNWSRHHVAARKGVAGSSSNGLNQVGESLP